MLVTQLGCAKECATASSGVGVVGAIAGKRARLEYKSAVHLTALVPQLELQTQVS